MPENVDEDRARRRKVPIFFHRSASRIRRSIERQVTTMFDTLQSRKISGTGRKMMIGVPDYVTIHVAEHMRITHPIRRDDL